MRKHIPFLLIFLFTRAYSQTFTGGSGPINDVTTQDFPLAVSGLVPGTLDTLNFGLETVCVDLTHTWDSDVEIRLVAPDGTTTLLVSSQGGDGDNYTNTCFNVFAPTPITAGTVPFTGTFEPMGQMGIVNNGQNGNGTWILRITDLVGGDVGFLNSWSITFGPNPATYFPFTESDLPIFIISTNGQSIPDEPRIPSTMGVIWNGDGVRNHMTDPWNHYDGHAGIETRGASSSGFPKQSYDIELWTAAGVDTNASLLTFPSENDWVLSAQYTDKTLMRSMMTFYLFRQMGWWAPRTRPVELVLNGEYLGIYLLMEKVKRDGNRIDVPRLDADDLAGDSLTGGYIVKLDRGSGSADPGWNSQYLPWPGGDSIYINYYYPDGNLIAPQQAQYIKSYVDSFETALIGPDYLDSALGYRNFVNIGSCVDAFLMSELSRSIDAYRKSFYIYKDKQSAGGKLVMAPVWDYDLTYGNCDFCDGWKYDGWQYNFNYICGSDWWLNPFWFERMRQDPQFVQDVRCRWEDLRDNVLSEIFIDNYIDSMAAVMNESQAWNFEVWPILGSYVWPNYYIGQTYQEEVDTLKWWIHQRLAWMDNNLGGTPALCNLVSSEQALQGAAAGVYPNPFTDDFRFSVFQYAPGVIEARLLDLQGREVQPVVSEFRARGNQEVRVAVDPGLAAGVYVLRVSMGGRVWTKRVVKG